MRASGEASRGHRAHAAVQPKQADAAFCAAMLERVSRSFCLSIRALPPPLRGDVQTAYLLCRIVDTIEDQPALPPAVRQALFDAFEHQLVEDGAAPEELERACESGLAAAPGGDADRELCRHAGAVLRCYRRLPEVKREIVRRPVLAMSRGMRRYCARLDRGGRLWLTDFADLERYCYYVAGTVGQLVTGLFEQFVGDVDPACLRAIRARAVPFGLGLQMVNIVKDVGEDLARGVCYLPRRLAEARGVTFDRFLDPSCRDQASSVVADVSDRARAHLERAREYTLLWPGDRGAPVRLFCAVPLALALATLREIERGEDALRRERVPKVGRPVLDDILARVRAACADAGALEQMLRRYAGDPPPRRPRAGKPA